MFSNSPQVDSYSEEHSTDSVNTFENDERYEFAAPQFVDFENHSEDEDADQWFGKLAFLFLFTTHLFQVPHGFADVVFDLHLFVEVVAVWKLHCFFCFCFVMSFGHNLGVFFSTICSLSMERGVRDMRTTFSQLLPLGSKFLSKRFSSLCFVELFPLPSRVCDAYNLPK